MKRRQAKPWFKRGTVYRRAVDVLMTATEPLTAREIVERIFVAHNIRTHIKGPNKAALADQIGTVPASPGNHAGNSVRDGPSRWTLTP